MFRQVLFTQLKWTRTIVTAFALLAFILPAAVWSLFAVGGSGSAVGAASLMRGFAEVGAFMAVIACLGGFLLAVYPWTIDGASKHVYALSLPLTWSRFVTMRFAAGALSLLLPTLALWLGCLLALSLVDLPPVLHAYPGTLALRFLLASLVVYALAFALQYLAGRRSAVVLLSILVVLPLTIVLLDITGNGEIGAWIGRLLVDWPGPLAVFSADWSLIDV